MAFVYLLLSCNLLIFWFSMCFSFLFCVLASRDELQSRKVKLDYDEVGSCQKEAINIWDKKLLNCRAKIRCDMEDIHSTLKEGIYVAGLLALKSQDHIFCSLLIPTYELLVWEISNRLFPVAKNCLLFTKVLPSPAEQKIGSAVSAACNASNAETCVLLKVASCFHVSLHSRLNCAPLQPTLKPFGFWSVDLTDSEFQMFWFYLLTERAGP